MHAGSVILLVLKDGEGNLDFFVHPELHTVVADHDLTYLEALLKDFVERAKLHPAALFEQLSSLGAGPLVAHEVGSSISNHPPLLKLYSRFVQL